MRSAPRSQANQLLDLQQERDWILEDLKNRGQMGNLKSQNDFLKSFGPNARVNLYDEPVDPREAMLQKMVDQQTVGQNWLIRAGAAGEKTRYAAQIKERDALMDQRKMALEGAKFQAQRRQQARGDDLDERKFEQSELKRRGDAQYRNKALQQSGSIAQQRLQAMQARDVDRQYDQDYKEAVDAVLNQGMDPEEAANLFGLDPEDIDRLDGYASLLDADDAALQGQAQQVADYLNQERYKTLQSKQVAPKAPGFWDYLRGSAPELPLQAGLGAADLAQLQAAALKLGDGGVRMGPGGVFSPVPSTRNRAPAMFPEQIQGGGFGGAAQSIPTLTPQQVARVPFGTRYRGTDGKVRMKSQGSGINVIP